MICTFGVSVLGSTAKRGHHRQLPSSGDAPHMQHSRCTCAAALQYIIYCYSRSICNRISKWLKRIHFWNVLQNIFKITYLEDLPKENNSGCCKFSIYACKNLLAFPDQVPASLLAEARLASRLFFSSSDLAWGWCSVTTINGEVILSLLFEVLYRTNCECYANAIL